MSDLFSGLTGPLSNPAPAASSPTFAINLPGFDNSLAQSTYAGCKARGHDDDYCATYAITSQGGVSSVPSSQETGTQKKTVDCDSNFWPAACRFFQKDSQISSVITGGALGGTTGFNQPPDALDFSRWAAGIVGLILIAGGLFMLGLSSFNPIEKLQQVTT